MTPERCVRVIERRMRFLDSALDNLPPASPQAAFVAKELSALSWALPILCETAGVEQVYVDSGPRYVCGEVHR